MQTIVFIPTEKIARADPLYQEVLSKELLTRIE
jgi:hypothetical protein